MGEEHSRQLGWPMLRSLGRIMTGLFEEAREPVWLEQSAQGSVGCIEGSVVRKGTEASHGIL